MNDEESANNNIKMPEDEIAMSNIPSVIPKQNDNDKKTVIKEEPETSSQSKVSRRRRLLESLETQEGELQRLLEQEEADFIDQEGKGILGLTFDQRNLDYVH